MPNLSVAVTADVTQLQTRLALAQADLRAFSAQTRKAANDMRAAGEAGSGQMLPGLQAAAAGAAKAKAQIAELNTQMAKTAATAGGFRERLAMQGGHIGLRIADYTSMLSKLGEVMAAGYGADRLLNLVDTTAQMGEQLLKLSEATGISTETLSRWHFAAQQLGIDTKTLDTALVRLAKSIQQSLMSPTSSVAQSFNTLGLSQEYLRQHSNDLQAVLLKMADAVRGSAAGGQQLSAVLNIAGRSAADLVPFLQQGSDGLARFGDEANRLGDTISGPQAVAMEHYEQSVKRVSAAWEGFKVTLTTEVAPALAGILSQMTSFMTTVSGWFGNSGAAIATNADLLKYLQNQLSALQAKAAQSGGLARWWDDRQIIALEGQIDTVTKKLQALHSAAAIQSGGFDVGRMLGGGGTAPKPQAATGNLLDNTEYDQVRAQYMKLQAQFASSRDAMLKASVDFWAKELQNTQLDATQKLEVEAQYWTAVKALRQRAAQESSATAKKDAANQAAIERDKTNTTIQLSKIELQSKRSALEAEVEAGKITASQEVTDLKTLADQEYQLDLQTLNDKLATLQAETGAYQQTYDKILILKAQHVAQMQQLDLKMAVDQKKALDQQSKDWTQAGNVITRSFDQVLTGVLRGTQTWQQAVARLFGDLVVAAIENIAKLGVQWALGEAKRLLLTQATNTAIVASDTAQAAASSTAQNAINVKPSVLKHAGSAAAAVYDDVAQIPYVGWLLAPPAAAAAFAAVAAFGSFDAGAWQVPTDMVAQIHQGEMIVPSGIAAGIRAGQGVQAGFPSAGGGSGVAVSVTIQAIDTQTGTQFLKNNIGAIAAGLAQQMRLNNSRLNAAMQPT